MKLLLRMHPAQDLSFFKVEKHKNIIIADDAFLKQHNIQLYELLSYSNALITDYSSVYYDYLLTNRPIGLTIEDEAEYRQQYGLLFDDLRKELPGIYIDSVSDLKEFLVQLKDEGFIQNYNDKWKLKNEFSAKRIYEIIMHNKYKFIQ